MVLFSISHLFFVLFLIVIWFCWLLFFSILFSCFVCCPSQAWGSVSASPAVMSYPWKDTGACNPSTRRWRQKCHWACPVSHPSQIGEAQDSYNSKYTPLQNGDHARVLGYPLWAGERITASDKLCIHPTAEPIQLCSEQESLEASFFTTALVSPSVTQAQE